MLKGHLPRVDHQVCECTKIIVFVLVCFTQEGSNASSYAESGGGDFRIPFNTLKVDVSSRLAWLSFDRNCVEALV